MNKTLSMLGLARKANKLVIGRDCVKDSIVNKKSKLIVVTQDISERSFEKLKSLAKIYDVSVLSIKESMDDMCLLFCKKVSCMSVNDEGFAKKIIELEDIVYD